MKAYYRKDEFVYMDCHIKMSQKAMSDLLYAVIKTRATIPTTFSLDIDDYDRKQQSRFWVSIKIYIHPNLIPEFEELAGVKLEEPERISINAE